MRFLVLLPVLALACTGGGAACTGSSGAPPGGSASAGGSGGSGGTPIGGTGGSAWGTGGQGGEAAGGAGGERVPAPAWALDAETWAPVDGEDIWNEECRVEVARPGKIGFPGLEWEPCGPACERADLVQGLSERVAYPEFQTRSLGSKVRTFLAFGHVAVRVDGRKQTFDRVIDLVDGSTSGMTRRTFQDLPLVSGCSSGTPDQREPLALRLRGPPAHGDPQIRGALDPRSSSWWWSTPWRTQVDDDYRCAWMLLDPARRWFLGCPRKLLVTPRESSALEELESLPDTVLTDGASDGSTVTWSEVNWTGVGSRIRYWNPEMDSPAVFFGEMPVDVCKVAVGDGKVAAFSVGPEGGRDCGIAQPNGRFHLFGPDRGQRLSPSLVQKANVRDMATWGPYLAALVYLREDAQFFGLLIRTTDWAARRIDSLPNQRLEKIGLSDRFLYVVHTPTDRHVMTTQEVYRFDLGQFDAIGVPFVWPEE